jgi:hypothetical protein
MPNPASNPPPATVWVQGAPAWAVAAAGGVSFAVLGLLIATAFILISRPVAVPVVLSTTGVCLGIGAFAAMGYRSAHLRSGYGGLVAGAMITATTLLGSLLGLHLLGGEWRTIFVVISIVLLGVGLERAWQELFLYTLTHLVDLVRQSSRK